MKYRQYSTMNYWQDLWTKLVIYTAQIKMVSNIKKKKKKTDF